MARLQFIDLKKDTLWELRQQIVLNSLYTADFKNTFGFSAKSVQDFFDGYMSYIWELCCEDRGHQTTLQMVLDDYDNPDNLLDYFWTSDDYSWVEYDPEWTDKEMEEYEKEWN